MKMNWKGLRTTVVPAEAYSEDEDGTGRILYEAFLSPHHLRSAFAQFGGGGAGGGGMSPNDATLDVLYANRPLLEAMFTFFDTDNSGTISRQELTDGCAALNQKLPPSKHINEATLQRVMGLMDVDGSGEVDINE